MLEKVADSARKAVKLAEPYKPYGVQFLEFCSISLSTYQTCMKLTRKSTEFCQFFCRHYPPRPTRGEWDTLMLTVQVSVDIPAGGNSGISRITTRGNVPYSYTDASTAAVSTLSTSHVQVMYNLSHVQVMYIKLLPTFPGWTKLLVHVALSLKQLQ